MTRDLERLQKKLAGDGPAEKQVLLLKLMHEFETAPNFGEKYVADASSEPQQWIARIGALLARVGLQHKVAFQSCRNTCVQYWRVSREPFRQLLMMASEEIKLELELDGHEDIGQVYGSEQQYDFQRDLRGIIQGAQKEVFVVDPYFDGQAFDTFLSPSRGSCSIRVLCSRYSNEVAGPAKAFMSQYKVIPELKRSKALHDRVVIIDRTDCWVIGGSIKDAGAKPTYLLPLQPTIAQEKINIYEDLWCEAAAIHINP
ncbi:hypothetical protein [Pseudovibrio sp. Ad26]|uniref:hypothetical protein n=1 Tax=Pseudovibrio sp. Ad26 TaxID=989410 RepID=UPI0007AE9DB3|nr:hypothetical protein [Pseudovibrio sp. Ad26]KZL10691.1 hypothetical protein PsAD26_03056 [Pseudovibrio sp. Ad26]